MRKRVPLLLPTLGFCSGIAMAQFLSLTAVWGCIILVLSVAVYLYMERRKRRPSALAQGVRVQTALFCVIFLGAGIVVDYLHRAPSLDFENEVYPPITYARVLTADETPYGDRLLVEVERMTDPSGTVTRSGRGVKALIYAPPTTVVPGDVVAFPTGLQPIAEEPGREQWAANMHRRGILWQQRLKHGEIMLSSHATGVRRHVDQMRDDLAVALEYSLLSEPATEFLKGLLLADRTGIDTEVRQRFSAAGVAHVLAVSGLHLGIIAMFLMGLVALARLVLPYHRSLLIVVAGIWLYVLFVGMPVSAVRAAIMLTAIYVAMMLERPQSSLNSLCAAILLILAFDPAALFDVSFQLSVVCVGALILFAAEAQGNEPIANYFGRALLSYVAASVVVVVASWPLTAYYFSNLSLLFLPVNLAIVPLLPVYMGCGILYLSLLCFGVDVWWIAWLLDRGYDLISALSAFAEGGAVSLHVSWVIPALWLGGVALAGWWIHNRRRYVGVAAGALCAAAIGALFILPADGPADGVVLAKRSGVPMIIATKDGNTAEKTISAASGSMLQVGDKKLYFVGAGARDYEASATIACDYLVLLRGCDRNIERLLSCFAPKVVVVDAGDDYPGSGFSDDVATECRRRGVEVVDLAEVRQIRVQ